MVKLGVLTSPDGVLMLLLLLLLPALGWLGGVEPSAGRMALPVIVSLEKPAGRLNGGIVLDSCLRGDLRSTAGGVAAEAVVAAAWEGEEGGKEPSFSRGALAGSCCTTGRSSFPGLSSLRGLLRTWIKNIKLYA